MVLGHRPHAKRGARGRPHLGISLALGLFFVVLINEKKLKTNKLTLAFSAPFQRHIVEVSQGRQSPMRWEEGGSECQNKKWAP